MKVSKDTDSSLVCNENLVKYFCVADGPRSGTSSQKPT